MVRVCLLFFLFLPRILMAQNGFPALDELSFDLKYMGGKILKHTDKIHLSPPAYSSETEFSISHRTYGKRAWEANMNFPVPALNICYTDYRHDQLGKVISVYPSLDMYLLRMKKFGWSIKLGGGVGYATQRWNRQDTLNNYIGSHLNNFTVFQNNFAYIISRNLGVQTGIRISHISNGSARQPNFGINLASVFLGLSYYPVHSDLPYTKEKKQTHGSRLNLNTRIAYSIVESKTPDGPLSGVYSLSLFGSKDYRGRYRFFLGTDISYNKRIESFLKNTYVHPGREFQYSLINSVFGGCEFLFGRVGIPAHIGFYTYYPELKPKLWYQKVGFHYYFYQSEKGLIKRMSFSPLLKTHLFNADYIEFCLGLTF